MKSESVIAHFEKENRPRAFALFENLFWLPRGHGRFFNPSSPQKNGPNPQIRIWKNPNPQLRFSSMNYRLSAAVTAPTPPYLYSAADVGGGNDILNYHTKYSWAEQVSLLAAGACQNGLSQLPPPSDPKTVSPVRLPKSLLPLYVYLKIVQRCLRQPPRDGVDFLLQVNKAGMQAWVCAC